MARPKQVDELDEAVEAIMTDPDGPLPRVNPSLSALLRVAADLRDLPSEAFRARLKTELLSGSRDATAPATGEGSPEMVAHDLRAALGGLSTVEITRETTAEEADASMRPLAWLNQCLLGVTRFSGRTPWERHPDGDELLHVLDGEVDVEILTDEGPTHVIVPAGSVFVCPRGRWHRQLPRPTVTLFFATPAKTTEISWADDPRRPA